jgi:putative (di)nucleoside polyphosphate hydrolase
MGAYRPNVALILRRRDGRIFICERSDVRGAWQFPQGGVKRGESPEDALRREVREEIGLGPEDYRVIGKRGPFRYPFRDGMGKPGYSGQEQLYYLAELIGREPVLDGDAHRCEFCAGRWIEPEAFESGWLPPMKREVYRRVLREFFAVELR